MTISPSDALEPACDETSPLDHVMIDIETMSLHPHKALILSIGMVRFDPTPLEAPIVRDKRTIVLDLAEQLLLGRRVDCGTQEFWAKQPPTASDHWVQGWVGTRFTPLAAILSVEDFVRGVPNVWANGTQFDLSNLIGLAEDIKHTDPLWHYQTPRDMRTFVKTTPATRIKEFDFEGVPHEPIYDCLVQIHQVWSHWPS